MDKAVENRGYERASARSFLTIGGLYSYLYCMLSSSVLVSLPILGGAMYLVGYIAVMLVSLWRTRRIEILSRPIRWLFTGVAAFLFFAIFALMTIFPIQLESADFWRLGGIVLCVVLRPSLTRYILERALIQKKKTMRILLRILGIQLLFVPFLLLMLLLSPMSREAVWAVLGGFAVSGLLESFPLERLRPRAVTLTEEDRRDIDELHKVHAYKMFQRVLLFVAAALQVTQVVGCTYIAVTADALILCMVIALLCTYAASTLAGMLLRRGPVSRSDPNFLMAVGLVVWLYGLLLFIRALNRPTSLVSYWSVALCTFGSTICVLVLSKLEEDMRRVAAFGVGHASHAPDAVQQVHIEIASLAGQMIALAGLTLISVFTRNDFPDSWDQVFRSFSPLLTLPALLLVITACLFALLFPLTRQHLDKLKKYVQLRRDGLDNAPLHDQLEAVVVKKSLKRYGIKLIIAVLRPLYYHRIRGRENLKLDEDTPCIFVCNHGEIYGPVVTNLYVPFSFRPWVTYEMLDRQIVADRCMNGAFEKVTGVRRKILGFLMNRIGAPFLVWVMKSVGGIPVYHDNPRKLMQTFRETTAAMEAGDNILLFPENSATSNNKYVKEGVSEFFTGFTMIGQLYNSKTGRCPLFVPLYADKSKRVITFGTPTRYDASVNPNDERDRLCAYLRGEMLKLAGVDSEKK